MYTCSTSHGKDAISALLKAFLTPSVSMLFVTSCCVILCALVKKQSQSIIEVTGGRVHDRLLNHFYAIDGVLNSVPEYVVLLSL